MEGELTGHYLTVKHFNRQHATVSSGNGPGLSHLVAAQDDIHQEGLGGGLVSSRENCHRTSRSTAQAPNSVVLVVLLGLHRLP